MVEAKKEKEERDAVITAKDALLAEREEVMRELMEKLWHVFRLGKVRGRGD